MKLNEIRQIIRKEIIKTDILKILIVILLSIVVYNASATNITSNRITNVKGMPINLNDRIVSITNTYPTYCNLPSDISNAFDNNVDTFTNISVNPGFYDCYLKLNLDKNYTFTSAYVDILYTLSGTGYGYSIVKIHPLTDVWFTVDPVTNNTFTKNGGLFFRYNAEIGYGNYVNVEIERATYVHINEIKIYGIDEDY